MSRGIRRQSCALFYEKRVETFAGLGKELRHLDADAGVRILGRYLRRPCYAFVTRFVGSYTVMVYERNEKIPTPGKRIISKEFATAEELERFLHGIVPARFEAYVY